MCVASETLINKTFIKALVVNISQFVIASTQHYHMYVFRYCTSSAYNCAFLCKRLWNLTELTDVSFVV